MLEVGKPGHLDHHGVVSPEWCPLDGRRHCDVDRPSEWYHHNAQEKAPTTRSSSHPHRVRDQLVRRLELRATLAARLRAGPPDSKVVSTSRYGRTRAMLPTVSERAALGACHPHSWARDPLGPLGSPQCATRVAAASRSRPRRRPTRPSPFDPAGALLACASGRRRGKQEDLA